MCGRFTLRAKLNRVLQQLAAESRGEIELVPRFNISPTQDIAVVRAGEEGRELTVMRWGLIPSWSKDAKTGPLLINARSETAAEKPAFRSAYKRRRCLIPADGYYEWQAVGKSKQPYYFQLADQELFAFAGLWETWQTIESCTILTTSANELASQFHDRMPVILSPNDYAAWLDPDATDPSKLLDQFPAADMTTVAVNPIVNNARNEVPQCIEPLAAG